MEAVSVSSNSDVRAVKLLHLFRAAIFGMNQAAAKDAISSTCRSLLLRAETRKTFRGAISQPIVVPTNTPAAVPVSVSELKGKRKQTEEAAVEGRAKKAKGSTIA